MESVTGVGDHVEMDFFLNLGAGVAGVLLLIVGVYAIAAIFSDDLP